MKNVILIVIVFLTYVSISNAQFNPVQPSDNVTLSTNIIIYGGIDAPFTQAEGDIITVINKQVRPLDPEVNIINFSINAEAGQNITVTYNKPASVDGVILNGDWYDDVKITGTYPISKPYSVPAGDYVEVYYGMTSIDATNATSTGQKTFTIGLSWVYNF